MSVGQMLAAARAERGLSVDDVSAQTRIRATLVRDIENDDYHGCGGDVYARGHIRSIARVIGVDAGPLIAEYDAGHHVEPAVVPTAPTETDQIALAHTERRRPNWTAAMAVALLVIIGVAIYAMADKGSGGKHPATAGKRPGVHHHSTPPTSPPSQQSAPPKVPEGGQADTFNPGKASMKISVTALTWLSVTNASTGALLYQGDLSAGEHKVFVEPYRLAFDIGNAPAVDLVVNGKDLGSPNSTEPVVRGTIKPGSKRIYPA